jgi:hypothetical protein
MPLPAISLLLRPSGKKSTVSAPGFPGSSPNAVTASGGVDGTLLLTIGHDLP